MLFRNLDALMPRYLEPNRYLEHKYFDALAPLLRMHVRGPPTKLQYYTLKIFFYIDTKNRISLWYNEYKISEDSALTASCD